MKNFILLLALFIFCGLQYACNTDTSQPAHVKDDIQKTIAKTSDKIKETINTTMTAAPHAYGIDVSKFQGDEVDFMNKKKDSLDFVICKATEGITYTDPYFRNNWAEISKQGFIRGAYHFYRSSDDPAKQAKNYINAIKNLDSSDLPPIVDFEGGGIDRSQSVEQVQKDLLSFLSTLSQTWNRTPIIYTNLNIGNKYLNNSAFSHYPLWLASYRNAEPDLPEAWKDSKWYFWQKSDDYRMNNQKNDFDEFNGDLSALRAFIQEM